MFISIFILKQSSFRPPRKQQINFDPCTEMKSISIPSTKSSQFWCRDTKAELISISTLQATFFVNLYTKAN